MALAVKTSPDARSAPSPVSAAIMSLVGVVYLMACLAIIFKLLPGLWWSSWESLGLGKSPIVGGTLLIIVCAGVALFLLALGGRLLGPQVPTGVRAGIFVGFVGLLVAVLLARWASIWVEHWVYTNRLLDPNAGAIVSACVGGALVLLWLWAFTRPGTQKSIVHLEEAGWFSATSYKGNQGQKVRRGTMAGILLLVGTGIYTLMNHGTLSRTEPDWVLNVPFTGAVAIESYGDAQKFIAEELTASPAKIEIRWRGEGTNFTQGQAVSFEEYKAAVERIVESDEKLKGELSKLKAVEKDPPAYVIAVNQLIGGQLKLLLNDYYTENVAARLEAQFDSTSWEGLAVVVEPFHKEAEIARQTKTETIEKLPAVFEIPAGLLLVDRYAMRNVSDKASKSQNVKVGLPGDANLKEGSIVSREEFDKEIARLKEERAKKRERKDPEEVALTQPYGKTEYMGLTLLPSLALTVPLLLLAVSLWLAWRIVNMPTFADFLIATEAELNKVSWTTQKRLVQDTIVVLVTVVLMSILLFSMDWTWKVVLSWKPVGVLVIPKDTSEKTKSVENKRW